jgi:ribosomal protein S18 acetylase RimI-like enzyme
VTYEPKNADYLKRKNEFCKSEFVRLSMEISKVELDSKVESFIEAEQEKYETNNGISCNYIPFCFVAKHGDEMIGAVSGSSFFSEVYIDELVVKDEYRRKEIGRQLIRAVEEYFGGRGFNNINLCTNGFQASGFYEKCGFELEFVRENKSDPRLNKYFYIKYLD